MPKIVLVLHVLAGLLLVATHSNAAATEEVDSLRAQVVQDRQTLQDWANLARYRDENAGLAAQPVPATRVVFMGDSITDAWGRAAGTFFPGKPWLNRGISGQTTAQMLVRLRPDVIDLKPAVVVILAGTNDIAGNTGLMTLAQIEGNLASMVELAHANGIQVVMASLLPVTDAIMPQTPSRPPASILALNAWIEHYCVGGACTYLDYFHVTVDEHGALRRAFTDDGLHPNARGYAAMAPWAEQAVARAMAFHARH